MEKQTVEFDSFLDSVAPDLREFVSEIDGYLTANGCVAALQEKRSGFFVSYAYGKPGKSAVNFLFRKKGLIIRIYGGHVNKYAQLIDTLPEEMIASIKKAPVCKRMIDPTTCNQKCAMGNDFFIKGEHMQKCRNNCFMFDVSPQNNPYIKAFVEHEIQQRIAE